MMRKPNSSSKTLAAAFVAAAFGASAGAALAQTTTSHNARDEAAASSTAARHVELTRQQNEQTLHFTDARNLRICNLSGQAPSATESINAAEQRAPQTRSNLAIESPKTAPRPIALQVGFAGRSFQVQPGNCYDFRARAVRLSPTERLPAESVLDVSVAQMSGNGFVNGRTETASSDRDTRTSVKQLKEQLKQQDEQERRTNAELSQAREKLAQTTRDLKQAESKQRHVASAERHTQEAARQQQQKAQQHPSTEESPR